MQQNVLFFMEDETWWVVFHENATGQVIVNARGWVAFCRDATWRVDLLFMKVGENATDLVPFVKTQQIWFPFVKMQQCWPCVKMQVLVTSIKYSFYFYFGGIWPYWKMDAGKHNFHEILLLMC